MNEVLYFTQLELANVLKISPKTLEMMRQQGTGPIYCKMGRRVLYKASEIEAYLEARTYRSTSEY